MVRSGVQITFYKSGISGVTMFLIKHKKALSIILKGE